MTSPPLRGRTRGPRRSGVRVAICEWPVHALERLSAGERFDVVICDVRMPALSGIEFFKRACIAWPEIEKRILFLSGGMPEDDAQFLYARGLPFLPKPLPRNGAELAEMVRELVARVGRSPTGTTPAPEPPQVRK
jgi:CheY-like chemotaxis protein